MCRVKVEETDAKLAASELSFTLYSSQRCVVVAASCQEEKDKWVHDLQRAINGSNKMNGGSEDSRLLYASLKSNSQYRSLNPLT